jgi:hypothetical protein
VVVGAQPPTASWWVIGALLALWIVLYGLRWRSGDRLDHDPKTGMQLQQLRGWEARRFVKTQLEQVDADAAAGTTTYRNPRDGKIWVMDYPGYRSPRLRLQRDSAAVHQGYSEALGQEDSSGAEKQTPRHKWLRRVSWMVGIIILLYLGLVAVGFLLQKH